MLQALGSRTQACRAAETTLSQKSRHKKAHALAAAQHLHLVGADFGAVFFDAGLVGPLAGAQRAFHIDLRTLAQVLACDFSQTAVEHHTVPLGGFLHFARLLVFPAVGGGDGDVGHLVAAGEGADLGVAPQVADDDDFIDRCHGSILRFRARLWRYWARRHALACSWARPPAATRRWPGC